MSLTHVSIGATLKKIRENKGYTQQEISDNTMARSTYTKFERNDISPTLSKYLAILDHMDMSHEEFLYILNDYSFGDKEKVLYLFKQLERTPDPDLLDVIIEKGEKLVQKRYDQLILDILNACRGYKALFQENDMPKAKEYAQKVWARLETLDYWYMAELHVLNSILYVFDSEAAAMLTEQALSNLKRYSHFEEATALKISFLLHLTNLLMMDQKYSEALRYIEQMEAASRSNQNLLMWATALIRKEVCLVKSGNTGEHGLIKKASQLLEILDKPELKILAEKNPEYFCNLYVGYPEGKSKDEIMMT